MTIIKAGKAQTDTSDPLGSYVAHLISDAGGLTQFGAFIEELAPGAHSSFAHWHQNEDEMMVMISGEVTVSEAGVETLLHVGDATCWKAGDPVAHTLHNHSSNVARYLVVGTRAPQDVVTYPYHDRVLHFDRSSGTRRYTTLADDPSDTPSKA